MICKHGVEMLKGTSCKRCYLSEYRKKNGRKDCGSRRIYYDRFMVRGDGECAMTFSDIGAEMGVSKAAAQMLYNSAMGKMRRKPQSLKLLRDLIAEKQRIRNLGQ